jgi:replicative superfamily II helicase
VKSAVPVVHVYLVPYRALASEMHDSFLAKLKKEKIDAVARVASGDHSDPIHPQETDILIATYERFAGILRLPDFAVGCVVVDEAQEIGYNAATSQGCRGPTESDQANL